LKDASGQAERSYNTINFAYIFTFWGKWENGTPIFQLDSYAHICIKNKANDKKTRQTLLVLTSL